MTKRVLLAMLFLHTAARADRVPEISVITGMSMPINGLNYNAGIGVRGGWEVGKWYLGGMLAVHQGDNMSIMWGAVAPLGIDAGKQHYSTVPVFTVFDAGYNIDLRIGRLRTKLTPYASTGMLFIPMSSSGVYGDSSITNSYFVIGGGTSWSVPVSPKMSVGLHWRIYNVGDTSFDFGDLSQGTYQHGFSTSIFYNAWYAEMTFRLR